MEPREIRRAPVYTVEEVATVLGVTENSVRRWIRDGDLAATMTRPGTHGGYRISHDELEAFVRRRNPYMRLDIPE